MSQKRKPKSGINQTKYKVPGINQTRQNKCERASTEADLEWMETSWLKINKCSWKDILVYHFVSRWVVDGREAVI